MLFIPYGSKHYCQISGAVWKRVICSNCGCDFVYKMTRRSEASATSLLWVNESGSRNDAKSQANSELKKQLDSEFDLIHCPNCGYFQNIMVEKLISIRKVNENLILFPTFSIILLLLSMIIVDYFDNICIFSVILWILLLTFLIFRKSNYDPNKDPSKRLGQSYSEKYPVMLTSELLKQQINENN